MKSKSNIPPILLQKGYTEIVQINSNTNSDISAVYKVNRPGIGYWIVKRIVKEFAVMYRTEKAILTSLRHDFLPIIFDVFEDEKALYIAIEFISGESFRELMSDEVQVTEAEIRKYFLQLCEIFEYLHIRGVIHKDCKPSNVMLSDQGNVHLIDFGVSKSGKYNPGGMSQLYAPPEQIADPNIDDPRTDIYSLGATMYSLLTQETPNMDSKRQSLKKANISPNLRGIILRCMEHKPSNRYQTMTDLKKAIAKKDWAWKTVAAFSAMLVSVAIIFFAFFTWSAEITDHLITRGDTLMAEGNYQLAMQHYETFIVRRPAEPLGFERRRRLLVHRGEYSQAVILDNGENNENFFADSDFANAWHMAVGHAIVHYYQLRDWPALLELLDSPPVQLTLDQYKNYRLRAQIATHNGNVAAAIIYYKQLLDQYHDCIGAETYLQDLLNGATLAHGEERYHFLAAAIELGYASTLTDLVYSMLVEHISAEVLAQLESGNLLYADQILTNAFDSYPALAMEFELLLLRVAISQRHLLHGTNAVSLEDLEVHVQAALAAATENSESTYELENLLEIIGEGDM